MPDRKSPLPLRMLSGDEPVVTQATIMGIVLAVGGLLFATLRWFEVVPPDYWIAAVTAVATGAVPIIWAAYTRRFTKPTSGQGAGSSDPTG